MIPLKDPASYYEEDFHRHEFFTEEGEAVCTIEFDDLNDDRNGLWAEVTVYWHMGGGDEPDIAYERANLQNKTTGGIKGIKLALQDKGRLANWDDGFSTSIFRTIREYRGTASEGSWLEWVESTPEDNPYLLYPFIASDGVTVIFGTYGSNKSMFAGVLSLGVATGDGFNGVKPLKTGPVLYVDFEDSKKPHQFRFTAFARSLGMEPEDIKGLIYYEKVTKSMKDARRKLRKLVRDLGIVMVVIDSIGLARAADVSGSEATIKLFKMFSSMGVAIVAIDHMTKEDNKKVWTGTMNPAEATPIGSQFTASSARLTWFMNLLPDSTSEHKKFNMHNPKNNHGPTHESFGMTIKLTSDKNMQIHTAKFETIGMAFYVPKVDSAGEERLTKEMDMLKAHFVEGRDTDGVVTALTATELIKLTGIAEGTVRPKLRSSEFWSQVKGSKQYRLTPEGLELAVSMWSGDVE